MEMNRVDDAILWSTDDYMTTLQSSPIYREDIFSDSIHHHEYRASQYAVSLYQVII